MSQRRFPGINPFQTHEKDRFFGRDDDIRDLHALIRLEKTVVLFGKSGHGKSSLLNAGIVPKFLAEQPGSPARYEPLVIKFGARVEGDDKLPPAEAARQLLQASLPSAAGVPPAAIWEKLLALGARCDTLWHAAKRSGQRRILLVFDQFEEFFTYPLPQQQRFADELGELLRTDLPDDVDEHFAQMTEAEQDFLAEKMDAKAVFAIREDRLHLLDKLKYPLPAIFSRRYALLPLPRAQAKEAIAQPAALEGDFASPPFRFAAEAMEKILDYLADAEGRVEANHLQILAEAFEKRAETERIGLFSAQNLGALKSIVADYYHEKIAALPDDDRLPARKLCEEGLAQEGDPPMRLTLHEAQIQKFYEIGPALLETLVRARLLRAEPSAISGYTYELPHDTLLEPVLDARRARHEADAKAAAEKASAEALRRAAEAEQRAADEKRRADEAERLKNEAVAAQKTAERAKRRAQTMTAFAVGLAVLAAVAGGLAYQQSEQSKTAAENARLALEAMQKANAERLRREILQFLNAAERMQKTGDYDMARTILEEAQRRDSLGADSANINRVLQNLK